ncbi:hypothetical protein L479_00916 [Exiguobacterium sp. S17]|nr:hypothetical protein L479_00916 [Exiguobacterium sp. S17]
MVFTRYLSVKVVFIRFYTKTNVFAPSSFVETFIRLFPYKYKQ